MNDILQVGGKRKADVHRLDPVHRGIDKRPDLCGFPGYRSTEAERLGDLRDPTLGAHGVLEPEPQDRLRKIILPTP